MSTERITAGTTLLVEALQPDIEMYFGKPEIADIGGEATDSQGDTSRLESIATTAATKSSTL